MDKEIVIGGEATINAELEGETKIDTAIDGEFGWCYAIAPVPPSPEPTELVIKDVMFMDYDGSVVASYDAADFIANVTTLPTPPSHDGLTFQEWNWTLADIKTELQTGSGACCIGANYETTDGKTHFYINLTEKEYSKRLQLNVSKFDSVAMYVDWGDGTIDSRTSGGNFRHLYNDYGEYDITVYSNSNWAFAGAGEGLRSIPISDADLTGQFYTHANYCLKEIHFGSNAKIQYSTYNLFRNCQSLKAVTVPKNIFYDNNQPFNCSTLFEYTGMRFFTMPKTMASLTTTYATPLSNWFVGCTDLITVSYPKGFQYLLSNPFTQSGIQFLYFPSMTTWDCKATYCQFQYCIRLKRIAIKFDSFTTTSSTGANQMFMYAYNIEKISLDKMCFSSAKPTRYLCYINVALSGEIVLPSTFTQFTGEEFNSCHSVTKYTMLGDITKVGTASGSVFASNTSCLEWDFTHCTTVPTLYSTNCFSGIRSNAKIKVPASLEASWKTAANWSTYASYIVGV